MSVGAMSIAAKYRFLHQDGGGGLDVGIFPRIFLSRGSNLVGDNHASLLLPIWIQKDWNGGWSAFGGGGCTVSDLRAVEFCQVGGVVTYQILPKLQIGAELFHQTAVSSVTPARPASASDTYHLLGYVSRGMRRPTRPTRFPGTPPCFFTF